MLNRLLSHIASRFFLCNLFIGTAMALIAGHLIVTHGRKETLAQFLKMPHYYTSVAYSAGIALLLIMWIYAMGVLTNGKRKRPGLTWNWILNQLVYGVVLTIMLELLLATALFYWNGHWILETAYFRKLFGPIVMFILLVNLCYTVYYLDKAPNPQHKVRYQIINDHLFNAGLLPLEEELPALIYIDENGTWKLNFYGNRSVLLQSLDASFRYLPKDSYFRGHRNWIINKMAISAIKGISGKRLLVETNIPCPIELIVARRRAPAFKKWIAT